MTGTKPTTDHHCRHLHAAGARGIGLCVWSGPEAASIAAQLVRLRQPLEHARAAAGRSCSTENSIRDAARIDEAVVTFFWCSALYIRREIWIEIDKRTARRWCWSCCWAAHLPWARDWPSRASSRSALFWPASSDLTQAEAVRGPRLTAQKIAYPRPPGPPQWRALSRRVAPVKQELVELIALARSLAKSDFLRRRREGDAASRDCQPHRRADAAAHGRLESLLALAAASSTTG